MDNWKGYKSPFRRPGHIYKAEKLSVCLSDGHAAYSPDLARIDIVCADNEALIIRLL